MKLIDGDRLMMSLADWWFSSFGDEETEEAKSIRKVMDKVEASLDAFTAQQWVPVSERLPEKPNMYTVTDSKGDVVRFVFQDTESSRRYWLRCAKAWMPLPEPYKGGTE